MTDFQTNKDKVVLKSFLHEKRKDVLDYSKMFEDSSAFQLGDIRPLCYDLSAPSTGILTTDSVSEFSLTPASPGAGIAQVGCHGCKANLHRMNKDLP